MKVALAGASGMVGKALTRHLTAQGHTVVALRRNHGGGEEAAFVDVNPIYLNDFDAVINLAGENIAAKRWTDEQKKLIKESRVQTTTFLAKTLAKTTGKPTVFINASAVGYYGNRGSETLTESSSAGTGFLPEVCQDWERATEYARRDGLRVVRARIGVIISKEGGALAKMLLPFQMGAGGNLGSGQQYMSWISIEDIIRAFEYILKSDSLEGAVNLVSPQPVTNAEFTKVLGEVLHRPAILPAPAFALKIILGDMAQEMLLEGCKVTPSKLESAGFKFEYPGLKQALEKETK